ncbi:MAG: polysaccharide biosynthesis tyrosine autokinase [Chthoniobacteraceae bacterium]
MDAPNSKPGAAGETGSPTGVRFYRYRAVIKRFWWVLLLCISVGLLYEVFVLVTKPTRYVSIGKLKVSEPAAGDTTAQPWFTINGWGQTIVEELKGSIVRERAVKKIAVEKPQSALLTDGVEIAAINEPNTFIFSVTGLGQNPEITRLFVDTTMEAFMQQRREESVGQRSGQLAESEKQVAKEKEEMDASRAILNRFQEDNSVPFIEQQAEQISTELSENHKSIEALRSEVNTYKSLNETGLLDANAPKNDKKNPGQGGDSLGSRYLEKQEQLAIKESELKDRATVWKPAHPRFQQLEREVADLRLTIGVLKDEASKNLDGVLRRINAEIQTKEAAIEQLNSKAKDFSVILAKYTNLKKEVDRNEAAYTLTRAALDKIRSSTGAQEILAIRQPASPAVIEDKGLVRHLLTGLIGGLLLGIGILFLLDRSDDRLASSSEMIEQFNEAIVGQIPDVASSRTNVGLPLLQEDDQRFMFAEAFRSLRSSLIFMPNQTELKTLIVTSAIPNEGKSTITSNLAITMAAAGARVLLVDADLRRGDIAALFDIDGRQGLSNVLRGEVNWKTCIQKGPKESLHIIPRGPTTNQSGELLLLPIVPKLLEEWKAVYDLVIFNTAPILATDDTPTLAPNFDGTLMVIRASFTSARLTRNALNSLYQRQVNVLGLILNCVDTEVPGYYYYQYPKYYAAQ